jgi:hypothetical protein
MDCSHANLLSLFHRPGRPSDLAPEDAAALDAHFAVCPACAAALAARSAHDAAIGAALLAVPVPTDLPDRLRSNLASQLRWAWRRSAVKAALAASLLVAAYGAFVAFSRPTLDLAALSDHQDRLWQAPAHTATDWLAANGLSDALPEAFDLQLATFVGRRELQGVPALAMRLDANGRQTAWVYFLRSADHNLRDAQTGQYTSNVAVRVYRDLPGGWTVVVAYTGNNLNAFLRGPGSDA